VCICVSSVWAWCWRLWRCLCTCLVGSLIFTLSLMPSTQQRQIPHQGHPAHLPCLHPGDAGAERAVQRQQRRRVGARGGHQCRRDLVAAGECHYCCSLWNANNNRVAFPRDSTPFPLAATTPCPLAGRSARMPMGARTMWITRQGRRNGSDLLCKLEGRNMTLNQEELSHDFLRDLWENHVYLNRNAVRICINNTVHHRKCNRNMDFTIWEY